MPQTPRYRVLVVDDDVLVRSLFRHMIDRLGHDATLVESGEDALSSVTQERPHLVLLDHRLPGMTGLDVLEDLRRDPAHRDLPVFLVTGVHEEKVMARARALGVAEVILKPVDYRSFMVLVQRTLANRDPLPAQLADPPPDALPPSTA